MNKLSKRITAMLLSGMLVIGSVPGSVFAASNDVDPGQTSEIAEEVYDEESSEAPVGAGETAKKASAEEEAQYYVEPGRISGTASEVFTEEETEDC